MRSSHLEFFFSLTVRVTHDAVGSHTTGEGGLIGVAYGQERAPGDPEICEVQLKLKRAWSSETRAPSGCTRSCHAASSPCGFDSESASIVSYETRKARAGFSCICPPSAGALPLMGGPTGPDQSCTMEATRVQ